MQPIEFVEKVGDLLQAQDTPAVKRQAVYDAARAMARSDWPAVQGMGLVRLFLRWVGPDPDSATGLPHYMTAPHEPRPGEHLPATAMTSQGSDTDALAMSRARDARIEHAREALADWRWPEADAICFVCSREEWQAAKRKAGVDAL